MLRLGSEREKLNVIVDQIGTPTYAGDLAQVIMQIIQSDIFMSSQFESLVYHYSNEGVCSWYDFAQTIFELADIDCRVSTIETKNYPSLVKRPHYSVLSKVKIKNTYNFTIPHWKSSLQKCLKILREQS